MDIAQAVTDVDGNTQTAALLSLTTNSFYGPGGVDWSGTEGLGNIVESSDGIEFNPGNSVATSYVVRSDWGR